MCIRDSGVVIITTKRGQKDQPLKVDYNGYVGMEMCLRDSTKPSYEEDYKADAPMNVRSQYGQGYTFPCLFHVGENGWALISETGVDSKYCGSHLSDCLLYTSAQNVIRTTTAATKAQIIHN